MQSLVSVITPTWKRNKLLLERCIPSIQKQTYQNFEHIIVSDGEDPDLENVLVGKENTRFVQLGRNWRQFSHGASYGAVPRAAGTYVAKGQYIAYLDDDDEFLPDHIQSLVELIEAENLDFAFSQMLRDWSDGRPADIVGNGAIGYGYIGTPMVVHKAETLLTRNWGADGYAEDYSLFKAWADAKLRFKFLPRVTIACHKEV